MVKREPNIIRGRLVEFIWIGYIVFGAFYVFTRQPAYGNPFIMVLSYAFIGLLNIGAGIAQVRFWRKQDQRRQQAANGDQSLVAYQQPTQDAASLTLPLTITQRTATGWTIILIVTVILLAMPFIGLAIGFASTGTTLLLIFILLAFIVGIFAFFLAAPVIRGYQTLTVDEGGISVRVGFGRVHRIEWDEAKLFAISAFYKAGYGVSSVNMEMRRLPEYYEVSSINDVVRWRWVRTWSFIAVKSTLPVEDYDRQMQALLSLVVAKTGLTLYDVRPPEQRV